jgi:hypothetical protein
MPFPVIEVHPLSTTVILETAGGAMRVRIVASEIERSTIKWQRRAHDVVQRLQARLDYAGALPYPRSIVIRPVAPHRVNVRITGYVPVEETPTLPGESNAETETQDEPADHPDA